MQKEQRYRKNKERKKVINFIGHDMVLIFKSEGKLKRVHVAQLKYLYVLYIMCLCGIMNEY